MKMQLKCVQAAMAAACALMGGTSFALDLLGSYEKALAFDPAMARAVGFP